MQYLSFLFLATDEGSGAGLDLLDYISKGGILALLLVILYGGFKERPWWVFGWVYRDLQKRYEHRGEALDEWWDTARSATSTAEKLVEIQKSEIEKG